MARKNKPARKKAVMLAPAPAGRPFRENLLALFSTAVLTLFFFAFVAQAVEIPSGSMEDTLLVGDRLFVDRVSFAPRTPWLGSLLPYQDIRAGDVIVFKHPAQPDRIHMVKRVIGLPGDRVRIVNRQVIVNGHLKDEGYKVHKDRGMESYRDNFPSEAVEQVYPEWREAMPKHIKDGWLVVPPGHYFVMGDNRDHSLDSRYWGFVPRENILGRPWMLWWSLDLTEADFQRSGLDRITGTLKTVLTLPAITRWNRMFRIIHGTQE